MIASFVTMNDVMCSTAYSQSPGTLTRQLRYVASLPRWEILKTDAEQRGLAASIRETGLAQKRREPNAIELAKLSQLDDVDAPFPGLTFGNERHVQPQARGHVLLCQASPLARSPKCGR